MHTLLSQKKVVIVGGSLGIGSAVAQMAHSEGALVTIAGRSRSKLEAAGSSIDESVDVLPLDVMDLEAITQAFEQVGRFDHLFISAQSAPLLCLRPVKRTSISRSIVRSGVR